MLDVQTLSLVLIARAAAVFFLAAALGTLVPGPAFTSYTAQVGLCAGNVAAAAIVWWLPWQRWSARATLWLVPIAFADLAAAVLVHGYNPLTFSMYYVVVFVWIGVAHPRRTSLWFTPLAALAYVVPMYLVNGLDSALVAAEIVPVSIIVGECLAWLSARLRSAEARDDRRIAEMRSLVDVAEQLARQTDPDEAYALIARLGGQLCRAEARALFSVDSTGLWHLVSSKGWPGERASEGEAAALTWPLPRETLERDPIITLSPPTSIEPALGRAITFAAVTIVALRGRGPTRGVLALARQSGGIAADSFERQIAMAFAKQAGVLLDRVEAVNALRSESLRDQLTGIGNRRAVDRRLGDLRPGDALVVIDLDNFKELNDTQGHAAGDRTLRAFAADLTATLRDSDFAARLGGDEFVLLLAGAGSSANIAVERLRKRWAAQRSPVGFSAGIAVRLPGEAPHDTLHRADGALYASKRGGRGITSEQPIPEELQEAGKTS